MEAALDEPDPQVVAAARAGDLGAFEVLIRRYEADVWRLCVSLVHDETVAEDAAQDAFVRVFRFLPRYRGDSKFTTWLFSIVRNCALDEIRRATRRRRTAERLGAERVRAASEHGVRLEVRDALATLPMDLREPVVWIDMFGLPYAEAARVLGVPVGTVKSRVHRARALLAVALGGAEAAADDG